MPNKKLGVNTKAVEAKQRKEQARKVKEEQIKKQKEDEYWRDDDKLINRKLERQQQRENKKQEQQQRKALNRQAYEEEMNAIPKSKAKDYQNNQTKKTRSQIQSFIETSIKNSQRKKEDNNDNENQQQPTHLDLPLEENLNRLQIDGDEARNIDDAIQILSNNDQDSIDKHPERRMKAAWAAFEEKHLQRLKQENPTLRLSQLKELLRKEFQKSSENPMNQQKC